MQRILTFLFVVSLGISYQSSVNAQVLRAGTDEEFTVTLGPKINAGGAVDYHQMLIDPEIRESVEILDYQLEPLLQLADEIEAVSTAINAALTSDPTRTASRQELDSYFALVRENRARMAAEVKAQLLPHQIQSLRLIAFNDYVADVTPSALLERAAVMNHLELTPAEILRLEAAARKLDDNLKKEIAALIRDGIKELCTAMPDECREKVYAEFGTELDTLEPIMPTDFLQVEKVRRVLRRLSDDEIQELTGKAIEIERELKRDIVELRRKAVGELLAQLDDANQTTLSELFGFNLKGKSGR